MKKLLLSLGALSAVVAPVAAVVACGSTDSDSALDQAKAVALKNTTLTQEQKDAINGAKTMDALTTVLAEQTNAAGNAVTASVVTDTATISSTDIKLGAAEKVYALGFTFGVKASDLNEDQSDFTQEFKDLLAKAGVANTKPVSDSIRSNLLEREKALGFIKVAGSAIDVISTNGAVPTATDEEAIIKAQLKLAGISRIFGHVQVIAPSTKSVTVAAKAAVTDDTFTTPNNFAVVNNLKAIKFVA